MANVDQKIAQRVQAFVTELQGLMEEAMMARLAAALGAPAPAARRAPARRPRSAAKAPAAAPRRGPLPKYSGGRRTEANLQRTVDVLLAHVKANPGSRMEQIAAALGTKTAALALPTKKLLASGAIKSKGVKRATRYFPS